MNCSSCKKILDDYISGHLAGDVNQDVKTHLKGCKSCHSEFMALRVMNTSIVLEKSKTPDSFITANIMKQIRQRNNVQVLDHEKRTIRPVWQNIAVAASISIAIVLGILAGNSISSNRNTVNTPEELVYLNDGEMEAIGSLGL